MSGPDNTSPVPSRGHGLVATCDHDGLLQSVIENDFDIEGAPAIGEPLALFVDAPSRAVLTAMLAEACAKGAAIDWELNVRLRDASVRSVSAAAVCWSGSIMVMLASTKDEASKMLEHFVAINNELVNTVRALQKRLSTTAPDTQTAKSSDDFGELMRLNNDLVNLQREMAKKNAELTASRRLVQSIVDTSPDIIYIYDLARKRPIYSNQGYERILGYSAARIRELSDDLYREVFHPVDFAERDAHFDELRAAEDGQVVAWEYRMMAHGGEWRWLSAHETVFERDAAGEPVQILGSAQDVTAQHAAEEHLRQLTIVDELTGLHNRRGLETLGERALAQAKRTGVHVGVMFADLDGFKAINDTLGHGVGDAALKEAANILRDSARAADLVTRVGGDEFVVLAIPGTEEGMERLRERLYAAFARANDEGSREYALEVSLGFTVCPASETCALDDLLGKADAQMYAEKEVRRSARER